MFTKGNFDILLLQETRTDGSEKEYKKWKKVFNCKQIYLTPYGTRAVGAGIIVSSEEVFKVRHHFEDPSGRFVGIVGDHEEGTFLVLSFYSPSVSGEIREFVINSIYSLLEDMGDELPQFLILGGDSNTVFSRMDKEGGNLNLKQEAINSFEILKERFSLFDSFRVKNPNKKSFTWEVLNPLVIRERIDHIFVSRSLQNYVTEAGIIPPYKTCSDHGIPFIKLVGYGIPTRGPGVWKLNNELLSDPVYVSEMNNKIPQWLMEAERDLMDNLGGQWGYLKHKIGEFSREYGAKIKKAKSLLKNHIEKELKLLNPSSTEEARLKYKALQDQLNDIIENEVKGVILRSLCDDYEKGEKCTKYFLRWKKSKLNNEPLVG